MTVNRPFAASPTASRARLDAAPASAATKLAHSMLNNGWTLTGATVRVIHTAHLTDDAGLTIAVSSEAGKVRLDFDSEYRYPARLAWHAEATRELPVEVLAAVTSANTVASVDDPTEVADHLTAAGWSQPHPLDQRWLSPDKDCEVMFVGELENTPLPWQIHHKAGRPVTIHASEDTPAAVIAALAITDAAPC